MYSDRARCGFGTSRSTAGETHVRVINLHWLCTPQMTTAAELAEQAEAQLLLADFVQAESLSRQALQRAVYLGDEALKGRAACVAIQALAETQR